MSEFLDARRASAISRRRFLKGAFSAFVGARFLSPLPLRLFAEVKKSEDMGKAPVARSAETAPFAEVVDIRSSSWRTEEGVVDSPQIAGMLERGLVGLTGKSSPEEAWKSLFSQGEKVGIKFNKVSRNHTRANQAILEALVAGLESAGVSRADIYPAEAAGTSLSGLGEADFSKGPEVNFGAGETALSRFLVEQVDCFISVADLKDHNRAGITGSLKNISHAGGTVMKDPWKFHGNHCSPYVGAICSIPELKSKRRLNITNGLIGVYKGGPGTSNPSFYFAHGGFLLSTDPVAVDRVAWELLDRARKERGLLPLMESDSKPIHVLEASKMGLGVDDLSQIRWSVLDERLTFPDAKVVR